MSGNKWRVKVDDIEATVKHCAWIASENAKWHLKRFRETGDRYHKGQWKAYHRAYLRLSSAEVLR